MQRILLVSCVSLYVSLVTGSAFPSNELHKELLRPSAVKTVIHDSFCELLVAPEEKCAEVAASFIHNVVSESLDIDTLTYQESTMGSYIDDPSNTEPVLPYLRSGLQAHRSYPPQVVSFFIHIDAVLNGTEAMSVFEEFLKDKTFNIDLIKFDRFRTVAEMLEEHKKGAIILNMPLIQSFTESAHDFKKLLKWALDDGIVRSFKDSYEKLSLGVDQLLYVPGKTISQYLSEQISRKGAIAVARIVQHGRTDKNRVLSDLYGVWEAAAVRHKERRLQNFVSWYKEFPANVDLVAYPLGSTHTVGERIVQLIGEPKTRAAGLEIARTVQKERSDSASVLCALLKAYESDPLVFNELATWVRDFPLSDVDSFVYDSHSSLSIGAKIDALGDDALKNLFKRSSAPQPKNSSPSNDPQTRWSIGQKVSGLCLFAGLCIAYYHYWYKDTPKKTQDHEAVVVAS